MMRETQKPRIIPCACCNEPSEVDCWQYKLCIDCFKSWRMDVEPPPDNAKWNPDANARQAQWRESTMQWLKKAKETP